MQNDVVSVRLFGTFEIENAQGRFCDSSSTENQSVAFLKYLMAHPTKEVGLPELMETVWTPNRLGGEMDNAVALRISRATPVVIP